MTPVKTFVQKVDKRSRQEMIRFLSNHFRYNTMNSWNGTTSYANNLKLYNVIPNELQGKAYDAMDTEDFYAPINDVLHTWGAEQGWSWQAGFNGRSSGYLVLYQGYREVSDHKSICQSCGQRNFKTVEETGNNRCGRCGKESRVNKVMHTIGTWPGRGTDEDEDFSEWSLSALRDRVELVTSFDQLCDDVVLTAISILMENDVVEEVIQVPKTIKVLQPHF